MYCVLSVLRLFENVGTDLGPQIPTALLGLAAMCGQRNQLL